jgi:hypothetical protein
MRRPLACLLAILLVVPPPARAWNAHGHRTITYLALDSLPADMPAWVRDPDVRRRIADASNEADRYRGWRAPALIHENEPDHYLDIDLLPQFGLTLDTLPPLRQEYMRALAVAKHVHPEQVEPYDVAKDPHHTKEWPGALPHAMAEHYAKLQHSFNLIRILEQLNDPQRAWQLQQAQANAIYEMGMLSHFVGDAAQPLHTTRHYNGWIGENPNGYTTSNKFHSYIDGGVLEHHGLTYETLRPAFQPVLRVNARDPWPDFLAEIRRAHDVFEALYQLEKDGGLKADAGKALIQKQLLDAADVLGALYAAAWTGAAPNEKQVADFVFFNELKPERLPESPRPAVRPAAASGPATQPGAGGR